MNINTRGVMLCFKYAAQQMIKQGGGGKIIGSSPILRTPLSTPSVMADVGVFHVHVQVLVQLQGNEVSSP